MQRDRIIGFFVGPQRLRIRHTGHAERMRQLEPEPLEAFVHTIEARFPTRLPTFIILRIAADLTQLNQHQIFGFFGHGTCMSAAIHRKNKRSTKLHRPRPNLINVCLFLSTIDRARRTMVFCEYVDTSKPNR
jgi:hypothetical protein